MRDATDEEWVQIHSIVEKIIAKSSIAIDRDDPDGGEIWLNGAGGDEYEHETFCLYKIRQPKKDWQDADRQGWDFCKTARKPYDEVVTACLITIAAEIPGYIEDIASDGYRADWEAGRQLAQRTFDKPFDIPFRDLETIEVEVDGLDRYKIEVDTTDLNDSQIAGAALDCFEANMKVPETAAIKVMNWRTELMGDGTYQVGSYADRAKWIGR